MNRWTPCTLTPAGRPTLAADEILHRVQTRVGLYDGQTRLPGSHEDGAAHLTSRRLLFVSAVKSPSPGQPPLAIALALADVANATLAPGFLRSSPKITLDLAWADPLPASAAAAARPPSSAKPAPWTCHVCQRVHVAPSDMTRSACADCGNARQAARACPACTFANPPSSTACAMCQSPLAPVTTAVSSVCPRCTLANTPSARACAACGLALTGETQRAVVKLSFRQGGSQAFYQALVTALRARASPSPGAVAPVAAPASAPPAPKPLGLSGIVAHQEQSQSSQREALSTAFADLDALMAKAQEMVSLSTTIASKLKQSRDLSAVDDDNDALVAEFRSAMLSLGATASLGTESGALGAKVRGDDRDRALARDLADFLAHVLPASGSQGGILALTDLYCMFNRARGVALVSPSDLWHAAGQLAPLGLPYTARELDSGARIVHTPRYADTGLFAELEAWAKEVPRDGLDAVAVAAKLGPAVSVALARQLLAHAARAGRLAVDAPSGRYFTNLFLVASAAA
ncbi:Vacuolar protein-sorting-associated protein 36 [Blastocladiella emersonii ATCC 22665]|nr:Vacuolar protein-sorting-associated protein 36 [Blastocladiella emersonii ATCC 22665]